MPRFATSRASRVHSSSLVLRFQRAASYPADVPLADGDALLERGGSAILAPDGCYLAGPLWDEEGILFADLDPSVLYARDSDSIPRGITTDPTCSR